MNHYFTVGQRKSLSLCTGRKEKCSHAGSHTHADCRYVTLNKILADNTGKPIDIIAKDTERDNFMSADEALDYGLVDKILYKR